MERRVGAGKKSVETVLGVWGGRGFAPSEGGGEDVLGLELLAKGVVFGLQGASLEPGEVALLAEQADPGETHRQRDEGEESQEVVKTEAHGGVGEV